MSARHAQLLRALVDHTVHQLSAMAHNPRKRTWQLVFWAVASRRGDDRSSAASSIEAWGRKKKDPFAPHVKFSFSDRFSEFLRNGTSPLFNLVAPHFAVSRPQKKRKTQPVGRRPPQQPAQSALSTAFMAKYAFMNTASKLRPHTQTDRGTCPGVGL
jgi:hypothetical protein